MDLSNTTHGKQNPQPLGNHGDIAYLHFLQDFQDYFTQMTPADERLLQVSTEGLWDAYLETFPPEDRQFHNCHCCRRFIEQYGGIVVVNSAGKRVSALWGDFHSLYEYEDATTTLRTMVEERPIMGVFLSSQKVLGTPATLTDKKGNWRHLSLELLDAHVMKERGGLTLSAYGATKRENLRNVEHALDVYSTKKLQQAVEILSSDVLYRSEKVLGGAEWLLNLARLKDRPRFKNLLWRAVASAPDGFCHPRSSMFGTLLDDLNAGYSLDEVKRRFDVKMQPHRYMRPTAAPTIGAIREAERKVEELGIANSLKRRFARLDEISCLWKAPQAKSTGGVFASVKPKVPRPSEDTLTASLQYITFEKFRREVLPKAHSILIKVPTAANLGAFVTATDPSAPPILQWDLEEARNPVSTYIYRFPSLPVNWGIRPGFNVVTAVALRPHLWGSRKLEHHGNGAYFIIEGAKDFRNNSLALFPEIMKSELHSMRAVIEAYSAKNSITGLEEASAGGIQVDAGGQMNVHLRVDNGTFTSDYIVDRWD